MRLTAVLEKKSVSKIAHHARRATDFQISLQVLFPMNRNKEQKQLKKHIQMCA